MGEIAPDSEHQIADINMKPVVERRSDLGVVREKYVIEAMDMQGEVVSSKEFYRHDLIPEYGRTIAIPFSTKVRVYNETDETVEVYVMNKKIGEVTPFSKEYFLDLENLFVDLPFFVEIIVKNPKGKVIFSQEFHNDVFWLNDWKVTIK